MNHTDYSKLGFTSGEGFLKRKTEREKLEEKMEKFDKYLLVGILVGALFVIAFALDVLYATPKVHLIETAQAAEIEEIRQNDWYCEKIKEGSREVVGAEGSITSLCAEWGIDL